MIHLTPRSILFPYTTLFRSQSQDHFYDRIIDDEMIIKTVLNYVRSNPEKYRFDINWWSVINDLKPQYELEVKDEVLDRKSTRLNSSHVSISYAVFCLKKKR